MCACVSRGVGGLICLEPAARCFCKVYVLLFNQVLTTLGRWVLEKLRVYSPYSGVTSNQSESFNVVLKRLQSWREVPVDAIVLSLFHLQAYYYNEVQRGFSGLGNYLLTPEFSAARRSEDEINVIQRTVLRKL